MQSIWSNVALILLDGATVCMCHFPFDYMHVHSDHTAIAVVSVVNHWFSVVVTSGSHLFVKDLTPFKLLFPFSNPTLCIKLSCHWWHQMTSVIVYSLRCKDGPCRRWAVEEDWALSVTTDRWQHTPYNQNPLPTFIHFTYDTWICLMTVPQLLRFF